MRPVEVKDADVVEAGMALQSSEIRVTGYSLRKTLGRGAPDRLMDVWDAYVALSLDPEAEANTVGELHQDIEDLLRLAAKQQTASMRGMAKNIQKASNRQAELLVAEREAVIAALKLAHAKELATAEQSLDAFKIASAQQLGEIQSLAVHLASEQRQRESMSDEVTTLKARADNDQQTIDDLRARLEEVSPRLLELESEVATAEGEIQRLTNDLQLLNTQHLQLTLANNAVIDLSNDRKAQLQIADAKINSQQIRIADLSRLLDAQRTEALHNRKSVTALQQSNERLTMHLGNDQPASAHSMEANHNG